MCGIAGFYSKNKFFSEEDLKKMTSSIAHRGPDSEGFYYNNHIGLGHRRLSILDLSERGNQPMTSKNGRYVIVYNGEVYNYREIGSSLKFEKYANDNFLFNSSTDSEAVLEAFSSYGVSAVQQFNGMFAFAIYDKLEDALYLFRDRLGIKPLFYYWDGKNFAFASELKALVTLPQIPKEINKNAIAEFLHLGVITTPNSIYKDIYKLEAGSYLKLSNNTIDRVKYWTLSNKITDQVVDNEKQAMVMLSDLLMSSVQYQLRSDVPYGVFLSGGIDSSLITAQAVNLSGTKINTFSIGFEENKYSESAYAAAIAKHLGTSHHEFIVSYDNALNLIEDIFDLYDEPFADSSAIPTMMVSKLAKQHVTVTLSGEGGDELFMGYGAYKWAKRLENNVLFYNRNGIAAILNKLSNRYKRIGKLLNFENKDFMYSHIFSQEQYYFSELEIPLLVKDESGELIKQFENRLKYINDFNVSAYSRVLTYEEKQSLFDIKYYLQDDLLTKVDRASMYYSLETRVPYLDHRIVEFASNLSPELKIKNGESKYILKEILYQYVPKKYFDRPKQGFAIPLKEWLQKELRFMIDDYLNQSTVEKLGIVNYQYVKDLVDRFLNQKEDYLYTRIWLLICLHKWMLKAQS